MPFFEVNAQGHHGYPQPEDEYYRLVYSNFCPRCGISDQQIAPFRMKRSQRAQHSDFLQLNWVFDALFVTPGVAADLGISTLTGIAFGPVLDHRTGDKLGERVQLLIPTVIRCAQTSQLPTVTCRPNNEEAAVFKSFTAGEKRYTPETPFCGRVKYYPPTSLAISLEGSGDTPDLFQTAEWFGSGGSARRLTLASERFVALVRQHGWRGLTFGRVREIGISERHRT